MLLTLYTIGTFMDRDGFAHPGQPLIAAGIRGCVKTVQRHLARAEREGWISIELAGRGGKGWRHYVYRATVPDHLTLDDLDESIADSIVAQVGEIESRERSDSIVSPPSSQRDDELVSPPSCERGDTMMSPPSEGNGSAAHVRGDNGSAKLATAAADRGDTSAPNVATQYCRTNSRSETPALRTHAPEEARNTQSRVARATTGHRDDEAPQRVEAVRKARKHLAADPSADVVRLYGLMPEEVEQMSRES